MGDGTGTCRRSGSSGLAALGELRRRNGGGLGLPGSLDRRARILFAAAGRDGNLLFAGAEGRKLRTGKRTAGRKTMKIEIMGYSGSGKSTLCRELAERYGVPALHLDRIQFLPNWEIRSEEEKKALVAAFLNENPEGWVIDGNYSKLSYERRNEEADQIIQLLFGRINCLFRCAKRFWKYRGKSRPDMGEGCNEKLDREFVRWILWEGRSKKARERYRRVREQYPEKVTVIRNQRQLDGYRKRMELKGKGERRMQSA